MGDRRPASSVDVAAHTKPATPAIHMHPVWLRFDDPSVEQDFRAAYDRASLSTVRLAALLGIVLYAGFGLLDARVAEDGMAELFAMRAACVSVLVAALAVSFHPAFPRFHQLVVCGAVLAAGLGMASMQVIADVPEAVPAMGTMLTLIFLFAFVRARLIPALVTAALIVGGYELSLLLADREHLAIVYLNAELAGVVAIGAVVCHRLEWLWRRNYLHAAELEAERARSDALLHNVLPESIARRLRHDPAAIAETTDDVTVLFADLVGFTAMTAATDPEQLVAALDRLFARFDALCDDHGVEKIKTIGDGYMAAAGAPDPHPDAAAAIAELALGIREATASVRSEDLGPLAVRIGVCTGPVLAGVIGRRRFAYDLWGDTVNTASRLESHGRPGVIQICERTRALLADRYEVDGPFEADLRGKGTVTVWHLVDSRADAAGRADGDASRGAPLPA